MAGPQQPPPAGVQHEDAEDGAGDADEVADVADADETADTGDAGDWRADHEPAAAICA